MKIEVIIIAECVDLSLSQEQPNMFAWQKATILVKNIVVSVEARKTSVLVAKNITRQINLTHFPFAMLTKKGQVVCDVMFQNTNHDTHTTKAR